MYLTLCSILLAVSITACGVAEVPPSTKVPSAIFPLSTTQDADTPAEDVASAQQFELNTAQGETILFSLNGGSAAKFFYEQLSLSLNIEDYGEHEKIFYPPEKKVINNIKIIVGTKSFTATLEDSNAAKAFVQLLQNAPVAMQMRDYSGFEKVGTLETSLPASNRQMTAQAGDIILYSGNQICVFYGTNSWNYTRLGVIDNLSGWVEALGEGDVTVTFSIT